MSTNQLPPLPEPHIGLPWRHNAKDGSIHSSAFTWAQMHDYALAAIAQQAQEPVANDRDCPHCNYTGSRHCGDVAKTHGGILNPEDCSHAKLFGSRRTIPPAPQVHATVDERAEFEVWARPNGYDMRRNDVLGHYRSIDTLRAWTGWQARAALQSPSPKTKGQP